MNFLPIAELTRDFCAKNNFELRSSQQAILDFVDAGIRLRRGWAASGSKLNDPIFCYMGQRAGQTTLWKIVNRALHGQVLNVYMTREQERRHTQYDDTIPIFSAVPEFSAYQNSLMTLVNGLQPDADFRYKYIIFDCGCYSMNKANDWWAKWNSMLRRLEDRAIVVVIS